MIKKSQDEINHVRYCHEQFKSQYEQFRADQDELSKKSPSGQSESIWKIAMDRHGGDGSQLAKLVNKQN